MLCSLCTTAFALEAPATPTAGVSVFANDVRVEAKETNNPVDFKLIFSYDTGLYDMGRTASFRLSVPADATGISETNKATVTATSGSPYVRIAGTTPNFADNGNGVVHFSNARFTTVELKVSVPNVTATSKITLTPEPESFSAYKKGSTDLTAIADNAVAVKTGSIILQYPVTVAVEGTVPTGASATVKTTEYDTDKVTYNASGAKTTTLANGSTLWVDSGAGQQNTPALDLTAPAGYKAEVKVGNGDWQLAGKNFSIGEVKAATAVSIRYTQTTADTVTISVTDKYGEYQLGTWEQHGEKHATKTATVSAKPYTGYTAYAYTLNGNAQVELNGATSVEVPLTGDQTITFLYKRTDGSAVVPGKDNTFGNEDDVTVTPNDKDDPAKAPTVGGDGKVTVPDNTTATVTRPKDPTNPAGGKENIIVPGGTTVDKDGTIHLPQKPDGSEGGTIHPGDKLPENAPAGTVIVTYKANGGTGDDVMQVGDGSVKTLGQQHTPPANKGFVNWNKQENGNGTKYEKDDDINTSTVLFAQWSNSPYTQSVEITFNSNIQGVNPEKQTIGFYAGTSSTENLRANSFALNNWTFAGWSDQKIGEIKYTNGQAYTFNKGDAATLDLHAQWYKQDGSSITVPGKDGDPSHADTNVTGAGNGISRDQTTGVVTIPNGGTITVIKNGQEETITLPNGGILNPDGSYTINLPNGNGKIDVDKDGNEKPKDDKGNEKPNDEVVTLTYDINNGEDDVIVIKALKGVEATAIANTFTNPGHVFLNWMANINGIVTEIAAETGKFTPQDDMTIYAQWAKQDSGNGSIELPGKDGILNGTDPGTGTDHAKDNVTVTPDKGGKVTPQPDGSVKVEDKDGTVTRPDPENPDTKEDIKVPNGTVVKPDGTIKLPDGTEIGPDQKFPDQSTQPQDYVVITYEPNGGTGDTVKQVVKTNEQTNVLAGDTFTAPANHLFKQWVNADDENNTYTADNPITPTANLTLKAEWKEKNPDPSVYTVTITYHSGNDTKTQRETGNSKQFSATLNTNSFTAPATDWTFMGWTTDADGGKNGTFYKDGGMIALDVTAADPDLYAVWYHKDDATGTIKLPGKDLDPTVEDDNITVNPGTGNAPTVKNDSSEGYIEANGGNTVQQPAGTITVVDGPVKVYPDGTIHVPNGSKVTDKDGNEVPGPSTIDPDGTVHPDTKDDPKKDDTNNSIIIPGKDGFIDPPHDADNLIVKPDGNDNATGSIDKGNGNTTITNPDGADVSVPGKNPPDTRANIKLPQGTVIKPDGTIILPDDKNGKDENGGTIPGGSEIDPDGVVTYRYTVVYLDGSNTELRAPTFLKLKAGESAPVTAPAITGYTISGSNSKTVTAKAGDTYTITFTYTKNNTSGGGSSGGGGGGGGGGSSTVSSYTIKASAGANGTISPNGSVSVARGKDQTFTISAINGYRIADVLVDGKSVGNVSTYTFENVKANHTIQAKFVKQASIIADPTETGVAGWLQTSEHIAYLGGYGNGLFGPTDCMTRAQAAQMFYNLLLNKNVDIAVKFTDVPADAWYGNAVHTLASLGIIKGIGNDQFAPNRTITRAEFAVIAMRFANLSATVTNPFTDIASNDWYYNAVTSAVSYGWITGYSDGTFRPYATITRAEVATIVNRMLARTADRDFVDSSAVTHFDDVPNTYWAYYSIAEATNAHTHTINNDGVESWGKLK